MKKTIFLSLATIFVLVSCNKEVALLDAKGGEDPEVIKEQVTVTATIPSNGMSTKVSLTQDGSDKKVIKVAWEEDDRITINGETFDIVNASISGDGKTADFTGTVPSADGSGKYNISYTKAFPISGDDYNKQTQAEDGSTAHLPFSVALNGASDYTSISFVDGNQGGTLVESSVLHLRAQLPDGAPWLNDIQKVIFKSSANVFNGSNTLTLTLTNHGTGGDRLLDIYAALPAGSDIALPDILVQFQVSANEYDKYSAYREFSPAKSLPDGNAHYLGIDCSSIASFANASTTGIGESTANPYLIGDQHQMQEIALSATKQYYKLVDDIDMSGVTWTPWNKASGFNDCVDFNGNDKSISHLNYPLFYVLKASTVKNLTFKDATISITGRGGTLAQFIQGTGTEVTNVDVDNLSVTAEQYTGGLIGRINNASGTVAATFSDCDITNTNVSSGTASHAGGVIGSVEYAVTITDCTFSEGSVSSGGGSTGGVAGNMSAGTLTGCSVAGNVTSTGKSYVGGLVGYAYAGTISKCCYKSGTVTGDSYLGGLVGVKVGTNSLGINNSYVSGNVLGTGQRTGGILGDYDAAGTCTIENCYVSGSVKSDRCVGGIVGHVRATGLSLIRCMPYNSEIWATSTDASSDYYSSGVVVGYSSAALVVNYCYRKNIADGEWPFTEYAKYSANNKVTNHGFITSAGSIPKRIDSWSYSYYHHGRKTSASNLSALVQMGSAIGESWDSDIWDFSKDFPELKK
ncbi:MAG: hypothetical protein IJQ22_09675 [Bacteroidales bacterium]|nr:hypothetical protein [Bacteroidales bacterium]